MLVIGLIIGGLIGVFIMCMLQINRDNKLQLENKKSESKEVNINFKEMIQYISQKDFDIKCLTSKVIKLTKENEQLKEEKCLVFNYLSGRGITLGIERNKIFEVGSDSDD